MMQHTRLSIANGIYYFVFWSDFHCNSNCVILVYCIFFIIMLLYCFLVKNSANLNHSETETWQLLSQFFTIFITTNIFKHIGAHVSVTSFLGFENVNFHIFCISLTWYFCFRVMRKSSNSILKITFLDVFFMSQFCCSIYFETKTSFYLLHKNGDFITCQSQVIPVTKWLI